MHSSNVEILYHHPRKSVYNFYAIVLATDYGIVTNATVSANTT